MRIAFYAPLKSPTHGTPSGDRRVAGLYMDALAHAGHRVQVASTFRSYDGDGDEPRRGAAGARGGSRGSVRGARGVKRWPSNWRRTGKRAPPMSGPSSGSPITCTTR